jgi:hypothetical protein
MDNYLFRAVKMAERGIGRIIGKQRYKEKNGAGNTD